MIRLVVLLLVLLSTAGRAVAATALGNHTTFMNNGPSTNRVDLVFLGDGYTAEQVYFEYWDHTQKTIDYLFNDDQQAPFPRYKNFFNAHRVNVVSAASGADDPDAGIFVNTALNGSYSPGGSRTLYIDEALANTAQNRGLWGSSIDPDVQFVTVNGHKNGGGTINYAVYSANSGIGGPGGVILGYDVAAHEMMHEWLGLADEYYTPGTTYTGPEPPSPNVTKDPSGAKWSRWLGYDQPGIGVIGAYEGGQYHEHGIYRPSQNSKMRSLLRRYDAIAREQIILKIYEEVDPLDGWFNNSWTLSDPEQLWVDTVDPEVVKVKWLLDGAELSGVFGEVLDIGQLGLGAGLYQLTAVAYDEVLDHAFTGGPLDLVRLNVPSLSQSVAWDVAITAAAPPLVPEPTTIALLLLGWPMLAARRASPRPT